MYQYSQGGGGYPGQQGAYPPQQGGQPGQGYSPQQGAYPQPSQSSYPSSYAPSSGYPPASSSGYPQQGAYPPTQGYPPQPGPSPSSGYPPQQAGYPPQTSAGYPQPSQSGYTPSAYPSSSSGYPQPSQSGYPPQQSQSGYPPQQPGQPGYPASNPTASNPAASPPGWQSQYYNQISPSDMVNLQAWFQSVDTDRTGEISSVELAQLNFNNKILGPELARKLIGVFDKDRSGSISFQEYASLHQFLATLQAGFYGTDRSRTAIPAAEVGTVLQRAGFSLAPTAAQTVVTKFDVGRRGALSWEEFLALGAHLALVRSIFEWSDTDRDGKSTFTYEQFTYATLYI